MAVRPCNCRFVRPAIADASAWLTLGVGRVQGPPGDLPACISRDLFSVQHFVVRSRGLTVHGFCGPPSSVCRGQSLVVLEAMEPPLQLQRRVRSLARALRVPESQDDLVAAGCVLHIRMSGVLHRMKRGTEATCRDKQEQATIVPFRVLHLLIARGYLDDLPGIGWSASTAATHPFETKEQFEGADDAPRDPPVVEPSVREP